MNGYLPQSGGEPVYRPASAQGGSGHEPGQWVPVPTHAAPPTAGAAPSNGTPAAALPPYQPARPPVNPQAAPSVIPSSPAAPMPQTQPTHGAPPAYAVPPTHAAPPARAMPPTPAAQPAAQPVASRPAQQPEPAARPRQVAAPTRIGMTNAIEASDIDLEAALRQMVGIGASDLHLTSGAPPMIRMDGGLRPLEGFPTMYPDSIQRSLYALLTQKQRETFESELELDLAYAVRGVSRFRVNLYRQRDSVGAVFRTIPYEIKPLEDLGVPAVVGNFAGLPRGLVLVTGPTGSGKSTTLAAIIDLANRTRNDHIMTVEDPIEFLHRHKKSLINQREVGADTMSFANALKHVLRQDPDIILVGEMRDLETISVALTAAETGHLVFATLHTQDAAQTIDRIIDVFPAHQQEQVRTQLASAIQGVVCQTLCKRIGGGRAVATEVMLATPAIRNLIREGKTHQIYSSMQAGAKQGMHTMDQHLAELVKTGRITYEVGLEKCQHVEDFNRLVGRGGRPAPQGMTASASADPMSSPYETGL